MVENKVIYIAHNWTDASVCYQSKVLALELSKRNKVVFLSAKKTGVEKTIINENLSVYEWPGKRPATFRDLMFALKLMKDQKPDVILSNFAANNVLLLAGWLRGVKVRMCHYHTMVDQYIADNEKLGIRQRFNIKRKGFFFGLATHILPPSTASKKDFETYYKPKKAKVVITPNSVGDQSKTNTSDNEDIGFLGRLHRSKGVDLLLNAFALVSKKIPSARLIVAGGGELLQELMLRSEILGVSEKVKFLGQISTKQTRDFMCSLNMLVVPSRVDNLPTVVLESFSTSTPVTHITSFQKPSHSPHP